MATTSQHTLKLLYLNTHQLLISVLLGWTLTEIQPPFMQELVPTNH